MNKIQQRYTIIDKCPNGVVGEKISVSIKLSEYFQEIDLSLSNKDKNELEKAMLKCLEKTVKIYSKYELKK